MMARNLIAMINCGAVVSQTCTRCGHVSSELTMLHRGEYDNPSPPDFDGDRLGIYSGQGSGALIIRVGRADRARSPLKISRTDPHRSASLPTVSVIASSIEPDPL